MESIPKIFGRGGIFPKNYVETRKYSIDLQIYIDFIVNRYKAILVRERIHDFRNGGC